MYSEKTMTNRSIFLLMTDTKISTVLPVIHKKQTFWKKQPDSFFEGDI
jgi:hypothetical protein